jgi:putative FmdB family regulatory protein
MTRNIAMPLYEYRCNACGHELEAMQKMSDPPLAVCPQCGESALKKKISAAAFRLKGGGWYETDFKNGKKKNIHESDKPDTKNEAVKAPKKETKQGKSAAEN